MYILNNVAVKLKNAVNLTQWFFVLIFGLSISSNGYCQSLSVGWEPWEPFQQKFGSDQYSGIDLEIFQLAAQAANMKFDFRETPWSRLLKDLQSGKTDVASGASKTTEREKWALFSNPYRAESIVLYVRKGESRKFNLSQLADISRIDMKIGVTYGYYYGEDYEALIKNTAFRNLIEPVRQDNLNFEKLVRGRLNGFLMEPISAKQQLAKNNLLGKVEIHPMGPIYSDEIHFMFSKKSVLESAIDQFNRGLSEVEINGTLATVLKKYVDIN